MTGQPGRMPLRDGQAGRVRVGDRGARTRAMITRLWRGWTATEDADEYERFLLTELFPAMRQIPGFRGAEVLRRPHEGEVAFVTLTRFDSLAAIRAFAGDDYEVAVLEPQALAVLTHYDERALHFDTAAFHT
jgi:heme-degrading monooxygenase HmoA